uniref:Uncharacterized protein n=1 Tax=Candidatus Enterococcus clewellii TaxID=1834193 RepID=A0A242K3B4_9ENTE|nr:hypothetical protein A5888_002881 [Enterococcus sp. 9E7_DIV0242]
MWVEQISEKKFKYIEPVSYTHLDVYKRQYIECLVIYYRDVISYIDNISRNIFHVNVFEKENFPR